MKLKIINKEYLFIVAAIIGVSIFQICVHANEIFDAPSVEKLNLFNGNVVRIWQDNKNRSWWMSVSNDLDKITVYVPADCGCNLGSEVQVGNTVKIGFYRSNFLSNIRAWSVRSNHHELVTYENSLAHHTGGTYAVIKVIFQVILMVLFLAAIGFLLNTKLTKKYLHKK